MAAGLYTLTVTGGGCQAIIEVAVSVVPPLVQPICLVTVDSASNRNKIMWQKVQTTGVAYYNIYKESTQANHYYLIDTVHFASMSIYVDPVSNPMTRSWRYKISAVDNCGNESELSPSHKTIHLTINNGIGNNWNLIWDNYDGFVFYSYLIYRHTQATGWEFIDTIPNNLFTYTDHPPSMGHLDYKVLVLSPDSCYPSSQDKTQIGPYSQSVSNIDDNGIIVEIVSADFSGVTSIFPNPVTDLLMVETPAPAIIELHSVQGQLLGKFHTDGNRSFYDMTGFAAGIYIVSINTGKTCVVKKLIKQLLRVVFLHVLRKIVFSQLLDSSFLRQLAYPFGMTEHFVEYEGARARPPIGSEESINVVSAKDELSEPANAV